VVEGVVLAVAGRDVALVGVLVVAVV